MLRNFLVKKNIWSKNLGFYFHFILFSLAGLLLADASLVYGHQCWSVNL